MDNKVVKYWLNDVMIMLILAVCVIRTFKFVLNDTFKIQMIRLEVYLTPSNV